MIAFVQLPTKKASSLGCCIPNSPSHFYSDCKVTPFEMTQINYNCIARLRLSFLSEVSKVILSKYMHKSAPLLWCSKLTIFSRH